MHTFVRACVYECGRFLCGRFWYIITITNRRCKDERGYHQQQKGYCG